MITFNSLIELADAMGLPDPEFDPKDTRWRPLWWVQGCVPYSESGLTKLRKRIQHRYEHTDDKGNVFIYFPSFLRMVVAAQSQ